MTELVEEITIKIRLNHCHGDGDSRVLGGRHDLRESAVNVLKANIGDLLRSRVFHWCFDHDGVGIDFENTGIFEAPEQCGGDN